MDRKISMAGRWLWLGVYHKSRRSGKDKKDHRENQLWQWVVPLMCWWDYDIDYVIWYPGQSPYDQIKDKKIIKYVNFTTETTPECQKAKGKWNEK